MEGAKGKPRIGKRSFALGVMLVAVLLIAKAWWDTTRDPVIKRIELVHHIPDGPKKPRRIVMLADIHVAGPDMPAARLARIVEQVNALKPGLILIAGDFVSDKRTATRHYSVAEALAPLAGLDPNVAKIAVPGNHDHWRDVDAISGELAKHRIGLLRNQVVNAHGIVVAGLDDDFTGHADLDGVSETLEWMGRRAIILSHSPDPFAKLPDNTGIMLAGHTHCGQIGWPWGGSPATMSEYGQRYACGVVRERGNILITSAGIGTSVLPFRMFTQPEIWVIDLVEPVAN